MIQPWQQILPIWNAKHRQNPLLFAQRVNSNRSSLTDRIILVGPGVSCYPRRKRYLMAGKTKKGDFYAERMGAGRDAGRGGAENKT